MKRAMRGAVLGIALFAAACASAPPEDSAPARVSVEVLRGFALADASPAERNAPVVILMDSTRSMLEPTRLRTTHHVAAQRAATRFASSVEALQPLWLFTIGTGQGEPCQPVFRGARASSEAARGPLLEEIAEQTARGEASLAAALDSLREELSRSDALLGSRVVVFSDLGSQCGGDVCASAANLVEGGARLEVVAIGEARAPACLREPSGLAESLPPPPTVDMPAHFRVEVSKPEPMVVGCSEAGGLPVAVPSGRGAVVVDLEPPLRVEANFAPGRRHVLQVLDFPSLDPPRRHWRWLDQPAVSSGPGRRR